MTNLPITIERSDIVTSDDADWLDQLRESILSVIVEKGYDIRTAYIQMYWEIGREIMEEIWRQQDEYKADQALPPDQQTRDPPASRNFIITNLESSLVKYEGFLGGTGKTALYDATNFFIACPTEDERERLLDELAKQRGKALTWNDICRKLLPGHDLDTRRPGPLYSGEGRLWMGQNRIVTVTFPLPEKLEATQGMAVRVRVTTIS